MFPADYLETYWLLFCCLATYKTVKAAKRNLFVSFNRRETVWTLLPGGTTLHSFSSNASLDQIGLNILSIWNNYSARTAWQTVAAPIYGAAYSEFGGSVMTHPQIINAFKAIKPSSFLTSKSNYQYQLWCHDRIAQPKNILPLPHDRSPRQPDQHGL